MLLINLDYLITRRINMEKSSVKHTMNNEYCYALDKDTIMIRISLKANDVKEV